MGLLQIRDSSIVGRGYAVLAEHLDVEELTSRVVAVLVAWQGAAAGERDGRALRGGLGRGAADQR